MKKIIICIIILIIFIVCLLLYLNIIQSNKKSQIIEGEYDIEPIKELTRVENINTYVAVENIINNYILSNSDKDINNILNILSEEYKLKNKINEENIFENIENIQGTPIINITDMKQNDLSQNITSFFVKYNMEKEIADYQKQDLRTEANYNGLMDNTTQRKNCKIIVNVDNINKTYSIMPEYDEINQITSIDEIEQNSDNKYNIYTLKIEEKIEKYMEDFKKKVLYDTKQSYEILDEEYKKQRFGDIQSYLTYVEDNKEIIKDIIVKKYKEDNQKENYTEYIFIDQYNNYYIFQEKSPMDYTVKLDNYTIDTQEFKEKYRKATQQQKVGMNLEKINQALNRKDYEYIYNKLDNTFKANNFENLDNFENYVKNTFFNINKIEYGQFNTQASTYIYETKVTDYTKEKQDFIEKIFIMKLVENEDFIISFNI